MQHSKLTNGSLGLPIEILEAIIARVLGSHPETRALFDSTSPRPITVRNHGHLIPHKKRNHAYMLLAPVCRLWHELAGAEFYHSCEIYRLSLELPSLVVNRGRIHRFRFSISVHASMREPSIEPFTQVLSAISAPIFSGTATLQSNLRELVITYSGFMRFNWHRAMEAIASLNNLESLGLDNFGIHVYSSSEDKVVLPPRLTTLDIRLADSNGGNGFYNTFRDTSSVINLRYHIQNYVPISSSLIQVLRVFGGLVHLDVNRGFNKDPAIHSPFILPKLRHLELSVPIEQSTLDFFARSANIQTLSINELNYFWEWIGDPEDLFADKTFRHNAGQKPEDVFKMIETAFLGPTVKEPDSLEQIIIGDLRRNASAPIPIQDIAAWDRFEMAVSNWTKRFEEKGIPVLARYDQFQTPRPIIPYVEKFILEETRKEDNLSALLSGAFLVDAE